MVDLIIDGPKAKTVGKPPSSILSWYRQLEGRKTFGKDEALTFENTGSNLERWKSHFPDFKIIDESSMAVFESEVVTGRPAFEFKTKPFPHQQKAFDKLKDLTNASLLLEMGLGKSKLLCDLIAYKWSKGLIDGAIILSPKGVHNQWVEEQLPTHMAAPFSGWAWDKGKKAQADLEKTRQFDGLQVLTFNIDAIKTDIVHKLIMDFIRQHKGRVLIASDEVHLLKNPSAQRSKKAYELASLCDYRAMLTGSPIVKNIADVFGEYRFLDGRIIGAKYFTTFRNEYCETKPNYFGGLDIIGAKNLEKLYSKIDPVTFRATKEELDLPEKMYDEYVFDLSDEQKKRYKEIKTMFMTETKDDKFLTVTNAASALVRLQQIGCGYLPTEEGDFIELPNPRLDALLNILEQRPGKVIIWARFKKDIAAIKAALKGKSVTYHGDTSQAERERAVKQFLDPDSGIDYFIGNPAAAGAGLNLQGHCTTAVYYSQSFNAVERFQSEDRIHRIGTKETCTYIDLIARGTVDKKIASNLKAKKSLADLAIDDIRKLFD